MTAIAVPLNIENYKKLQNEIYDAVMTEVLAELTSPQAGDLTQVYSVVFATVLNHIEALEAEGAIGVDIAEYMRVVSSLIGNAGIIAQQLQMVMAKQNTLNATDYQAYEAKVFAEIAELAKVTATV